jgi:uncharacterized membrane protein YeaQ/YmgE (transglycosylase-associated protein family)
MLQKFEVDMKVYFKIFGWLLYIVSVIAYLFLWIEAYKYISDKIGSFFTIVLILITNVVGPLLYIIWHWIADSFPSNYFFIWIGALVVYWIGSFVIGLSSDE